MTVVREIHPGLAEPAARSAVHSVFGLLNSTPHLGRPGSLPGRAGTAQLLHRMARGAFAAAGAMVGHGGVVAFDDTVDMARQARFAMEFCAEESCGKCTPCRIGSVRGVEVIDRIIADDNREANLVVLEDLCELMVEGSLCAMGGLTPMPVQSAIRHFPEDFERRPTEQGAPA